MVNVTYTLLHMILDRTFWGESVKTSKDSIIRRLGKDTFNEILRK